MINIKNNYKYHDILLNHYDEVLSILDDHSQHLKKMNDKYILHKELEESIATFFKNAPIATSTSTLPFSGVWTMPQ